MMKKALGISLVFGFFLATTAIADNGPGCGVGTMMWKGKRGLFPHSTAGSTNGTSGQPFAITSGTSGCDTDAVILNEKAPEVFVASNLDRLSIDMAQGSGAHLDSLASLMGCTGDVSTDFARMTQEKYSSLFTSETTDTGELLTGLKREIKADPTLASACTRIS